MTEETHKQTGPPEHSGRFVDGLIRIVENATKQPPPLPSPSLTDTVLKTLSGDFHRSFGV